MKILHITNNLWSGGVTTFLIELLNFLSKSNEITLLLLGKDDEPYIKKFFNSDIKIIFLNQKTLYSIKNILKIRKYIKENDIIHAHLCPAQFLMNLSSFFLKKKYIITEHAAINNRRKYKIFKILEKILYKKYDKIIAVSEDVKNNLIDWLNEKNKERIKVIYNGINLKKFKDGKNIRNSLWKLNKEEKLLFMVARFSKQKDYETLLRALRLLPVNIKCLLIGEGETQKKIREDVKNYNLSTRVKFLGFRDDVSDIMKSCDLGVLSTYSEGFGIVAIESLAAGTLMIGSNVDGLREILKKEELLFESKNEEELAKKIKILLYNKEKIIHLKKNIPEIIKDYSLEKMLINYSNIYNE